MTDNHDDIDLSGIASHRLDEAKRRVKVLKDYTARRISSVEAAERLQLSKPSFYRLLRAWTQEARPEVLGATGRHRNPGTAFDERVRKVIDEVEAEPGSDGVKAVAERARAIGSEQGIRMPSHDRIVRYVMDLRAARGERPDGVEDLVVGFCAVDAPVAHPERGVVAPIMCVLVSAAGSPAVLGLSLSFDDPSPSDVVRTLEDALARQAAASGGGVRKLLLQRGWEGPWDLLVEAMEGAALSVTSQSLRARSARTVTALIGNRPAGVGLKGDLTARTAKRRTLKVPKGGVAAAIADVEASLRVRLTAAFPSNEAAFADREALSTALRSIA